MGLLSPETAAKQAEVHAELTSETYAQAQQVVDAPDYRLQDTPHSLIYIRVERAETQGGHVLVVKATCSGEGLYVTSFRRLSRDEAKQDVEIARLLAKEMK